MLWVDSSPDHPQDKPNIWSAAIDNGFRAVCDHLLELHHLQPD